LRYIKCLATDGVPIVGKVFLLEAISRARNEAVACIRGDLPEGTKEISEVEYLSCFDAGKSETDKLAIKSDGTDTATVTVEVHPDITEVIFYNADTGEPVATVPIDPETHTAILQITATTPGIIRIRAGEPTITYLNEVTIHAVETS